MPKHLLFSAELLYTLIAALLGLWRLIAARRGQKRIQDKQPPQRSPTTRAAGGSQEQQHQQQQQGTTPEGPRKTSGSPPRPQRRVTSANSSPRGADASGPAQSPFVLLNEGNQKMAAAAAAAATSASPGHAQNPLLRAFVTEVGRALSADTSAQEELARQLSRCGVDVAAFQTELRDSRDGQETTKVASLLPRHFERLGHVVIAKLNPGTDIPTFAAVAKCFADAMKPIEVDVVVVDVEGIGGELRIPIHKVVWTDAATATAHGEAIVKKVLSKFTLRTSPPLLDQQQQQQQEQAEVVDVAVEPTAAAVEAAPVKTPDRDEAVEAPQPPLWTSLRHKGVMFARPYEPHGIPLKYNGAMVDLTPEEEEVATLFAALMNNTECFKNKTFRKNFFEDWRAILAKRGGLGIETLELCDFSDIHGHLEADRAERKKSRSVAAINKRKGAAAAAVASSDAAVDAHYWDNEERFATCVVDGSVTVPVCSYAIERPGLFRGRGMHPQMGRLKPRILPEDITLNLGETDPVPEIPDFLVRAGHGKWGSIVHDHNTSWIAMWTDKVTGMRKYVFADLRSLKEKREKEKAKSTPTPAAPTALVSAPVPAVKGDGDVCPDEGGMSSPQPSSSVTTGEYSSPSKKKNGKSSSQRSSRNKPVTRFLTDAERDLFTSFANSPTFTTHVENGIKYSFDAMRVMFCSGNTTERFHFGEIDAKGELVVDMFAGIGYFTLPLAKHGKLRRLVALEKNSDSAGYLSFNAFQNGLADVIEVRCGDNRAPLSDDLVGRCDRVMMGYIPDCKEFLWRAASFLKRRALADANGAEPDFVEVGDVRDLPLDAPAPGTPRCFIAAFGNAVPEGIIHYHFLADRGRVAYSRCHASILEELGETIAPYFKIETIRQVKSYAPKRYHHVADVRFCKSFAM